MASITIIDQKMAELLTGVAKAYKAKAVKAVKMPNAFTIGSMEFMANDYLVIFENKQFAGMAAVEFEGMYSQIVRNRLPKVK